MPVGLYISVGGHVCDFKRPIFTHCSIVSILADYTKQNKTLSTVIDALAAWAVLTVAWEC